MSQQNTIKNPACVEGKGLFTGRPCTLRFLPAPENTGIVFVRSDAGDAAAGGQIPCHIDHLAQMPRRTALAAGPARVETVEHVLAAVAGLGIDNVLIELSSDEAPAPDSSAAPFAEALAAAGIVAQQAPRQPLVVSEPVTVSNGSASLTALPGEADGLDILYDMDYGSEHPAIGRQVLGFRLGVDDFTGRIAPARTFLLESEAQALRAAGVGEHLCPADLLVMGDSGPVDNMLRFDDELVRHKVCDLIGDLTLLGRPLRGRLVAVRSGHDLNHALVRKLSESVTDRKPAHRTNTAAMDIRQVMRLLPHRYPFLMVDRVLEIDGDARAVGVKNVSINEPFFQGHFPSQPIMPGVMILEALAQISGILVGRRLEHTGKVAMLLSMDRVKLRRAVRPGDQLILEAQSLHIRPRTGHCRCRATVNGQLAAEAEIKFMLVDAESA